MIENETSIIRNSSKNYVLTHADLCSANNRDKLDTLKKLKFNSGARKQARDHVNTVKFLDHWLKEDLLIPVNYSSKWVYEMCKVFSSFNLTQISLSIVQDIFLFYVSHLIFDQHLELDPLDVWAIIELSLNAMIDVIATSYYLGLFNAISNNQLRYMNWLKEQMIAHYELLQKINGQFYAFLSDRTKSTGLPEKTTLDKNVEHQMNETLLLALLQYRIFLAQFRPLRILFKFSANFQIIVLFFLPVIIRIHISYITDNIQGLAALFPVTVLIVCDTVLVAMCRMHQMGTEIGRRIWSLQAASLELNAKLGSLELPPAYYEHSLQLYHKETHDPLKLARNFATITLIGPLTYPNLVQMHYWFFLTLISAFCEVESWIKLLGQRFYDPLGIFINP